MMRDLSLDHVVIGVRDLEAASSDYATLLGRRPSWRGEHPRYGTRNTLFRIDNTYIELLAPGGAKAKDRRWADELAKFLDERGDGVYALAVGTDNIDGTLHDMREAGLPVADAADGDGVDAISGARRYWRNAMVPPKATNGARIFFIEHRSPPDALPPAEPVASGGACVKRMDHAVVLSADMEISRRIWSEQIGARLALDRTFPDRNTRILFYRLGDITIEISGGAAQATEGVGKPDRIWGLAWGVDDLAATCARLREADVQVSEPRRGIKPGTLVATAKGPQTHGVSTLLIEHTPESFTEESRAPQHGAYDNAPAKRAFTALALDRIVLAASDVDGTIRKWEATLGLVASPRAAGPGLRSTEIDAKNTTIELAQPTGEDSELAGAVAARGQGMYGIAVRVDDVDAAIADLRSKGVRVSDAELTDEGRRMARVAPESTNGVPVDLIERPGPA